MARHAIQQRFARALEPLVERLKRDRSILAALLCGSLSHDTVWAKSDIDLVARDDRRQRRRRPDAIALYADGVNVHAFLMPRAEFRAAGRGLDSSNSFMHSLLAKGRLLYTHDETIARLCAAAARPRRARPADPAAARRRPGALPSIYKAHKWLVTRGDLDYTALWILYAATPLAQIEVIGAGCSPTAR